MPLHIAFLDSWLQTTAEGSGTAAGIGGLRSALQARGHTVSRLAPPVAWPRSITLRRLFFNLHLPALLRTLRYDLIVGFDIDGFRWSGHGKTPYLASIKGVIAEEMQHERGRVRALFELLSRLEAHNARHADGVLTTSAYCRDAIERHYGINPQRVRLVPEGIDLPRWRRMLDAAPRTSNGATIICVARQYPRKHIADLLQALLIVRTTVPGVRALIVGDGPEHQPLRQLAARLRLDDTVTFLGSLPTDEQVAACYRQGDIFCLPSVQEGFGIVFLEAMAAGLPIVATRSAAIPEVVPHGQAGILVPPGDCVALAAALVSLLLQPNRRAEMSAFGQAHVEQYDWDRVAGVFLDQIESVLA